MHKIYDDAMIAQHCATMIRISQCCCAGWEAPGRQLPLRATFVSDAEGAPEPRVQDEEVGLPGTFGMVSWTCRDSLSKINAKLVRMEDPNHPKPSKTKVFFGHLFFRCRRRGSGEWAGYWLCVGPIPWLLPGECIPIK